MERSRSAVGSAIVALITSAMIHARVFLAEWPLTRDVKDAKQVAAFCVWHNSKGHSSGMLTIIERGNSDQPLEFIHIKE